MAFEEKRAWVMLVVSILGYGVYVAVVLARDGALADVDYAAPMLWSIGAAIVVSIVLNILISIVAPEGANEKDQRDREIGRFGDYIGQSFVVIGGVSALLMALAEWDYFWIANAVYLAFVLSAVLGSVAKLFAYRRGFQPW
ncbi:hypothetical protein [Kribbella sancticallisti]